MSLAVRPFEEPDLDVVQPHQVLHVPRDIVLQQVGASSTPICDSSSGVRSASSSPAWDRRDLLLLLRLVGDLARECD